MRSPIPITTLSCHEILVAPSLLASDFANLATEIKRIEEGGADLLHLDVMDGHFVPNLTIGPPLVKSIRRTTEMIFDTHLMLTNPGNFVDPFADAGADHITFHVECADDIRAVVRRIRARSMSVGLSVKPKTPAEALFPYLAEIDLVLVMTVEPGFGGQSFMADMMPKVKALRQRIDELALNIHLEVDGGVDGKTVSAATGAGARMLVAGTSVFRAPEGAAAAITALKR